MIVAHIAEMVGSIVEDGCKGGLEVPLQVAGMAASGRVEKTITTHLDEFYLVVEDLLASLLT